MREITKEDLELMMKAFTSADKLIPINAGHERNPAGNVVRCHRRPGQTTAVAARLPSMQIGRSKGLLEDLDPPIVVVKKSILLGVVQMQEPSTTEQVLELMRKFHVEPADYHDFLAALHDDQDPLVGNVIVVLGSHIVDTEGRSCYPRYISRWKGERSLCVEYQDSVADDSREHNLKAECDPEHYSKMKPYPKGWPKEYRFLVRLKDFS